MSSPIDEIKARLDIVDVVKDYIKVQKAGANYRAICPFHSEKTPSFFISPSKQIWRCFGCGEGSSMFDFIMKIEGIEFGDALRILAKKAGVELKPERPELKSEREKLYKICELSTVFFEKQLGYGVWGKKAKEYLLNRTINEKSIKERRLGWAPDAWQGLLDFLISRGYNKEDIEKTGLALKSEKGKYYDRFRGRIIFPVFDSQYQVIGFGGRILKKDEKQAKYLNTSNTLLYDKGRILYGLDQAKVGIRKEDFVILVEGYIDVVLAHQMGLTNVVSTSGTALTPSQLNILKRYTDNLFLAFDMDFAGDAATKRAIDLAQTQKFNLKIIKIPEGNDPADLMSKSTEAFKKAIKEALSVFDFYFEDAFSKFNGKEPEGRKKISEYLLPIIKRINNKIEQFSWVQKLANRLKVGEDVVEEELRKTKIESGVQDKEDIKIKKENKKTRKELLEERLLVLVFQNNKNKDLIEKEDRARLSLKARTILESLDDQESLSSELKDFYSHITMKAEIEEIKEKDIVSEVKFCLNEIKNICLKDDIFKVSIKLKKAEAEGDKKEVARLLKKCSQLTNNN